MKGYAEVKAKGSPFDSIIQDASTKHGVPYDLLHKQLFLESSFNPNAVSPTGPRGLGQFTKATGMAYGLERDEDFFDPNKSVDAAARHMKDNIQLAGGDYLKALLIYNQGAGRNGRKQLEAYDRGDINGVSPEGLNYMRKLMDVTGQELPADPKPEGGFEEAQGSPFDAPEGVGTPSVQGTALDPKPTIPHVPRPDNPAAFNVTGQQGPGKAKPFAQLLQEYPGADGEDTGLFNKTSESVEEGIKNSVLGVMVRSATQEGNVDFTQSYTMLQDTFNDPFDLGRLTDWTDEEYERLRQSDLDPEYYEVVLRGYRRNFDQNLQLALENQKLVKDTSGAGLGAALTGGAVGAVGDPYSLVNPGRAAAGNLGGRLLGGSIAGGVVGGLSEGASSSASGREAHYDMAIAGGAAFGGLLNGLLGARPVRNSWDADAMTPDDLKGLVNSNKEMTPDDLKGLLVGRSEHADIAGTVTRLEAREAARLAGEDVDPTALPYREGDVVHETSAGAYSDVPFDPAAARTANGAVHSGGSPVNPKTIQQFSEVNPWLTKANAGVHMGDLTDIGFKLARSDSDDIRLVAHDLFRASTGYTDGSNGKFGATAADIHGRLQAQDNVAYRNYQSLLDEAHKDPFWQRQGGTKAGRQEMMSRRIVEAMEGNTAVKLTPAEKKLSEALQEGMARKWDYIVNPGQFGNPSARSVIEGSRHEGSYYPQRYSTAAKQGLIRELSRDGLQEAIARSWLASYAKRPAVKARVDKLIKESIEADGTIKATPTMIQKAVEKLARDKAYGISHTDQFNRSSVIEENLEGLTGLENNSYLEARNPFDSDVSIKLPDGKDFSVNDLREFDIMRLVPQYDRRVNGDVALMGGTGKSTKELKDLAVALHQKATQGANRVEATALQDALKMFTGRSRRDPDTAMQTFARSFNDVGFFSKNAYMWAQNFTETASLFVKGHQKMLLKNIPILKNLTTRGTKLKPDDIKLVHDMVFGRELDDLIRPTRADIIDRLRDNHNGALSTVVGSIKWATGETATRSPFTWLLRESGNFLLDAGRQGMITDLAHQTLNGKMTDLFSPERLRAASITPDQFKDIQALIKKHFVRDKKGGWKIADAEALQNDPRSMDLWRLGDRIADETLLRPHKMSNQASKQYGAYGAMVLQFKMFVLRSINGRMMRGFWEAHRNSQKADEAFGVLISMGLATAFYAAQAQLKAMTLPERKRAEYLDKAMDPNMMAYAAISRSSHIGALPGVANFVAAPFGFDSGAMVRTSILPREGRETGQQGRPVKFNPLESDLVGGFATRAAEQIPSLQVAGNAAAAIYSGSQLLSGDRGDDEQGHRTGLWNAFRQFVPNDPITQNFFMNLANDQGVDRSR